MSPSGPQSEPPQPRSGSTVRPVLNQAISFPDYTGVREFAERLGFSNVTCVTETVYVDELGSNPFAIKPAENFLLTADATTMVSKIINSASTEAPDDTLLTSASLSATPSDRQSLAARDLELLLKGEPLDDSARTRVRQHLEHLVNAGRALGELTAHIIDDQEAVIHRTRQQMLARMHESNN